MFPVFGFHQSSWMNPILCKKRDIFVTTPLPSISFLFPSYSSETFKAMHLFLSITYSLNLTNCVIFRFNTGNPQLQISVNLFLAYFEAVMQCFRPFTLVRRVNLNGY